MPPKGNAARSRQMALLASLAHQKMCAPELGALLDELACRRASSKTRKKRSCAKPVANRDRAVKLPNELVREISETAGQAHTILGRGSRQTRFRPLRADFGQADRPPKNAKPRPWVMPRAGVAYDALLDQFEPGASVRTLNPILSRTREHRGAGGQGDCRRFSPSPARDHAARVSGQETGPPWA